MQELHDLSKPFKYVVSCVIVQKNGAGFHIGHSAYWDISNDNICQVNMQIGASLKKEGDRGREILPSQHTCWNSLRQVQGPSTILWLFFVTNK